MDRDEVIRLGKDLRDAGHTYPQIAQIMYKRYGLISPRTRQALSKTGMRNIICLKGCVSTRQLPTLDAGIDTTTPPPPPVVVAPKAVAAPVAIGSTRDFLGLLARVLGNKKMDAQDRIETCSRLVHSQLL